MNERLFAATKKIFESKDVYRDYPTTRLTANDISIDSNGSLILPDGEWTRNNTNLPTPQQSEAFRAAGYDTDSDGRPLHPWLQNILEIPDAGVVTGKGFYRNWGPNFTADPVVLTTEDRPSVLLIQRVDTKMWALPGGFVDADETNPYNAATRELYEETNLDILRTSVKGELLYQDAVADLRSTAHAWAETSAYSFFVEKPLPVLVTDPKEVLDVQWFYVDEMPDELHGSHAVLIDLALQRLQEKNHTTRPSIRNILNTPKEELETTIIDAGHMAYDHMFVRSGNERLFVKAHDASRFTDAFREAHSRAYLQKEFTLFTQLSKEGFTAVPERVDLVDDSLLAMDALHQDDGWQWRAPEKKAAFDQYVRDVLDAFDQLQTKPIPQNPNYHNAIEPTYETFWKEGWDDIPDNKFLALTMKMTELSRGWNTQQQDYVRELIDDLPSLKQYAGACQRNVPLFMAHNDARQSNIAWQPEQGVKIVDWSWGDPAPKNSDSTMFLIDLVKSGYDVSPYVDHVNRDQVVVQIGMLLAHSLWQTRDGSSTVREQQVASASAAHRLLKMLDS